MHLEDMLECVRLVDRVLSNVEVLSDRDYRVPSKVQHEVLHAVRDLCGRRPVPTYPLPTPIEEAA